MTLTKSRGAIRESSGGHVELFALKVVMRSESSGSNATPFGIFGTTTKSKASFVYDHRGGRRSSSFELVQWIQPTTVGSAYPDAWNPGIQSAAYAAPDLDATPSLSNSSNDPGNPTDRTYFGRMGFLYVSR